MKFKRYGEKNHGVMQMNTSHFFIKKGFGRWSYTTIPNRYHLARYIITLLVTIFFSMQMVACGSAPKQSEMHASCGYSVWNSDQDASSIMTTMFEYQKTPSLRCTLVAPTKRYAVQAFVEWSNGWTEPVWITDDLKTESGQRYIILAQEKDGYSPSITDVKLGGYTSNAAKIVMYPLIAPVVAVHLPYYLATSFLDDSNAHLPKRPSEDCYIWIENGSTGEVIAGKAPSVGIKQSPDQELHER